MKHTPTPWLLDQRGERLIGSNGEHIGAYGLYIYNPLSKTDETVANAEFIVKACNSHDTLINTLHAALLELNYRNRKEKFSTTDVEIERIHSALKLAE